MNKQCGTCKWWDRMAQENAVSGCLYTLYPSCFEPEDAMPMASEEGNDCPVYENIED